MSVINTFIQWNIAIIMSLTQFLMTYSRQFKLKQGVRFFAALKEPLQKGVGNEIGLCMVIPLCASLILPLYCLFIIHSEATVKVFMSCSEATLILHLSVCPWTTPKACNFVLSSISFSYTSFFLLEVHQK